jgi:hypothetical protein
LNHFRKNPYGERLIDLMTSVRSSAEFADLIAAQDRRLEREGIPMYLALVSEVGTDVPTPPPACVKSGRRVAEALDRFRAAMAPSQRDDDQGVYISVMQAVSYYEFDASRLSAATATSSGASGECRADGEGHANGEGKADARPLRPHGPRDGEAAL